MRIVVYSLLWAMQDVCHGIVLIMGNAGCISSTVCGTCTVLSRDEAAFIPVQVVKRRDQPSAATWRLMGS